MEKNDSRVEFSRKTFPWKKLLIKRTLIFFVFKQIRLKNIMLSSTEKFSISEIGKSFTKLSIGLTWLPDSVKPLHIFMIGFLNFQTNVVFPFLSNECIQTHRNALLPNQAFAYTKRRHSGLLCLQTFEV